MKLAVTDRPLPRYHLVGTLLVVLALALALGASFLWIAHAEHQEALQRLERSFESKKEERLRAEMASAIGYLDFVHSRTEAVLRDALKEKVAMAMQTAQGGDREGRQHRVGEQEHRDDDDDDADQRARDEAGADWLSDQGFDRKD